RFSRDQPIVRYDVRIDPDDTSGWHVEMHLDNMPDTFRLAMAAHPIYDDRYWRYVEDLRVTTPAGAGVIAREDSALWRIAAPGGDVTVSYRIRVPPPSAIPRAAWRPYLSPTGALFGGPHTFMYLPGSELAPAYVRLHVPAGWAVATGLTPTADSSVFFAPSADVLIDSPILTGKLHRWMFDVDGVPHTIAYWPAGTTISFDSVAFVSSIQKLVREAVTLFGRPPYREYFFLFEDEAYGALEHINSVSLGAPQAALAGDPYASLEETAHEYFHTWNLLRIRPAEYRSVDYRTQPPVAGLWFSEGLTMFYADLLLRRAGLPLPDSTRISHLEGLIARYLGNPGDSRFSAEAVSRLAYNSRPDALGDYDASTHLQGELLGTMMDLVIRAETQGEHSMDDVMRLMLERFSGEKGFLGADVEAAVHEVCSCDISPMFEKHVRSGGTVIDFDHYLALIGLRARVRLERVMDGNVPALDLRVWAWQSPDSILRLTVSDPQSVWGRAGLHSGDRIVSVNGRTIRSWPEFRTMLRSVRSGEHVRVLVQRDTSSYVGNVVVRGYAQPVVTIEVVPGITELQRRLQAQWLRGDG
ncbi:MAG: PDZ domain-containing protein, partial [Gemmatimonadota bacterium]